MSDSRSDVLILGGGVIGLACALYLLRAGANVRVLEAPAGLAVTGRGEVIILAERPARGVVVFGRTSKAASRLSEQFRERGVEKAGIACRLDGEEIAGEKH